MGVTFKQSLIKIRRKLRDDDSSVWGDQLLRHYWNDVQRDVLRKLPELLTRWESQPFPQFIMDFSYLHDFEYQNVEITLEFHL